MTEKIGQLLIIGIRGKTLTQDEAEFIVKYNIGGVVLFARNIESPEQVHALCTTLQALRHKTRDKLPLFIGVDQEGGRVARLKGGFTKWPAMAEVGKLDSTAVAFKMALVMGQEMRAVGINLDFAPSVDVFTNPKNTAIGDRALSHDPEQVAKLASALVRGFIKSGIIPCAKHFPGHGNTIVDSHDDMPVEDKDLAELRTTEFIPFKKVFRARLDMVMTSHIKFPKVDPDHPVTFSEVFIKKVLREELRYRQIVITDDLDMGALAKHFTVEETAVRALEAGCDILLYCNKFDHPEMALKAIDKALKDHRLTAKQIDESFNRVVALKKDFLQNPDPLSFAEAQKLIAHADADRLSKAISAGSVPADLLTT